MTKQPADPREPDLLQDPPDMHFAGPDRRLAAYVIDVALVAIVLVGVQFILSKLSGGFPLISSQRVSELKSGFS